MGFGQAAQTLAHLPHAICRYLQPMVRLLRMVPMRGSTSSHSDGLRRALDQTQQQKERGELTIAHIFVSEVVRAGMARPEDETEKRLTIAVVDSVDSISWNDARRAVLSVQAMMAWIVTERKLSPPGL